MDCSISLRSLTVQGRLAWDTTRADLELRTGGLLVEEGGEFLVGEEGRPMELPATIHILDNGVEHHYLGRRWES